MEFKLLVHLCELAITGSSRASFSIKETTIDWKELWKMAARHQVRSLIYIGLSKSEIKDAVPPNFMAQLKSYATRKIVTNLKQTNELFRIIKIFKKDDIEVIPYKGVVLAQEAYQNIGAREFSDLDLMVKIEDLEKITRRLLSEKYIHKNEMNPILLKQFLKENCEYNFEYYIGEKRIFHIEPHWKIGPQMLQLNMNYNDLIPYTVSKSIFNQENITVLSPEGNLITTCLHHVGKEQSLGLKHVSDIASIVHTFKKQIDWDELLVSCKKLDIKNILLLGLGLTSRVFELDLPQKISTQLNSKKLTSLIDSKFIELKEDGIGSIQETILNRMYFHLRLRNKWRTKFKILFFHIQLIFKPHFGDFKEKEFSRWQYFLLSFQKPFILIKRYIEALTKLVMSIFRNS